MNIKSSQTLVQEARKFIETLSSEEVKKLLKNNEITLIDVRDIEKFGKKEQLKTPSIFLEECWSFG